MPRRRMEPGESGEVFFETIPGGFRALVYYRDYSGRRHRVKASGSSKAIARRLVTEAVADQLRAGGGGFGSSTLFSVAVTEWLKSVAKAVERGSRSPTTYDQYERNARIHVMPAVGSLKLSELTTGRLDAFLSELHDSAGTPRQRSPAPSSTEPAAC